jgi:hypothetical protein
MNLRLISALAAIIFIFNGCAPNKKAASGIGSEQFKEKVYYLASPELKGRYPGTQESAKASEYISRAFKKDGLTFINEKGFQNFDVVTSAQIGKNNQCIIGHFSAKQEKDFIPVAYSSNDTVQGSIVFAGYGFSINQDSLKWDDYKSIDVKNKIVLIFRGDPDYDKNVSAFNRYNGDRSKVLLAKEKGAKAVILVSPKTVDKSDDLISLRGGQSSAGIPVIHVKRAVADSIFKNYTTSTEALDKLIKHTRKSASIEMPLKIKVITDIQQKKAMTRNVIGILPGTDPVLKNEYIVIGGHYDHLGLGGPGSGSRKPDTIGIHYGADDNASGASMVMGLAQKLSKQKHLLKRSIIFITFDAEEEGLLGSKYFVNHPVVSLTSIKAMINLDMVGRLSEKKPLQVYGNGTALELDSIVKVHLKKYTFQPIYHPGGTGPSDHASFYSKNIPVLFFMTDLHTDYHTPSDTPDKINYQGMEEIASLAFDIVTDIANRPKALTFKEVDSPAETTSARPYKVSMGIMPDFASTDNSGVRVDAVTKGRPAEKGGILKGDVIISINGAPVKNIQDYMFQLGKCNSGDKVKVEVKRTDRTVLLEVQL